MRLNSILAAAIPLISDDKVATFLDDGRFFAVGSHPYHRPYRSFEDLGYHVKNFSEDFKPIHAFYQLEQSNADAEISIKEIPDYQKFDALMPSYLFMFSYLRPQRLKYLASMLNQIRVFQVKVPWEMDRLGEVHNEICEHSKSLI